MKIVSTNQAPKAIGPYSQAVIAGNFIFCSGQIALDPVLGEIIGKDIEEQTKQVLSNLKEVLKAADCDFANVIKTTIYLKNMSDFVIVNEIYAEFFGSNKPARVTVEVSNLPKNALIEIDCIAQKS